MSTTNKTATSGTADQQQRTGDTSNTTSGHQQDEKPVALELKEVTLKKDHTHAGTDYKPGDKIKVAEHDERWLRDQKIID